MKRKTFISLLVSTFMVFAMAVTLFAAYGGITCDDCSCYTWYSCTGNPHTEYHSHQYGFLWLNKCEYKQIDHTGITTCKECGNTWDYLDHKYQESNHDCPDKSGQIITYVGNCEGWYMG